MRHAGRRHIHITSGSHPTSPSSPTTPLHGSHNFSVIKFVDITSGSQTKSSTPLHAPHLMSPGSPTSSPLVQIKHHPVHRQRLCMLQSNVTLFANIITSGREKECTDNTSRLHLASPRSPTSPLVHISIICHQLH